MSEKLTSLGEITQQTSQKLNG